MKSHKKNMRGFSLIELLVALVLAGVLSTAIYGVFVSQNQAYINEEQVVEVQQNLRGGLDLMVREIRMAGYNPTRIATPGVTLGILAASIDGTGNSTIQFAADLNEDGALAATETIAFQLADFNDIVTGAGTDGDLDLMRTTGTGAGAVTQLLAENVDAVGLAFAFDSDDDDLVDRDAAGNIIWAIDTDGDNALDTELDTNNDGLITAADAAAGSALAAPVPLADIRAVQAWMLARSRQPDPEYTDNRTYVVANQRITPNDNFRRRLLTATFKCRNLGL